MTLAQLQDHTFVTKYARWNESTGRRETWQESVARVFKMHETRYAGLGIDDEMAFAKSAVLDRLVLGSQRALQFGGAPIESKNARMYNCTTSYCDRPRFFQEALWLLLCGCGVGFSVQGHHIARLPQIGKPSKGRTTFVIPDTIEGWADSIGVLVSSYFTEGQPHPEFAGHRVTFDYSKIRPKGAGLGSGVAKAPGPDPLKRSIEKIRTVLDTRLAEVGSPCHLRPIDAYDIVMHSSDAVLSGGVRRSATICIFSPDDEEMAKAKTGDWFTTNPQRGRSNNSAMLVRSKTSYQQFATLMKSVREFGEPGFVWADSTEIMYNPCVEIGLYPVDPISGETGWAFCNLCEINMKACVTPEIFERAARAASILGTLQAAYTTFPYLGESTERIARHEALLGCSMTGMMDNPEIAFNPEIQRRMAQVILDVNADLAPKLGINPCARATCVKPAGTTSCILGTSSGIHPHHAKRYFRRVQANKTEVPFQFFQAHNPRAVENSVWNPNGTDSIITFCIEVPNEALTKNTMGAIDLLEYVKLTQENWVAAGTRQGFGAKPFLRHNVSNTITVRDNEWESVTRYIYDNRRAFAGVSLLPEGGDLDYPQAPFCAVWTYDEIVQEYGVGSLFASGLIVDGLHAFRDDLWAACDCALGRRTLDLPLSHASSEKDLADLQDKISAILAQKDWVRRANKFAKNYLGGDIRRMTYCLKRVHNVKTWEDLKREYLAVDYTLMSENGDNTAAVVLDQACAGGKCQVGYA